MTIDPTESAARQSTETFALEASLDQGHFAEAVEMLIIGPLDRLASRTAKDVDRSISEIRGDAEVNLTTLDRKLDQANVLGVELQTHVASVGQVAEDSTSRVAGLEEAIASLLPLPAKTDSLQFSLDAANRALTDMAAATSAQAASLRRALTLLWILLAGLALLSAVTLMLLAAKP